MIEGNVKINGGNRDMKKVIGMLCLVFALSAVVLHAESWTGYISDSKCGLKGGSADHADCAKSCIKSGAAAVLVADGKLYTLDKQAEAKKFAGEKVTLTGTAGDDGKSIKVEKIEKADK